MTTNAVISTTASKAQSKIVEDIFIPLKIVKRGSHRGKILTPTYSAEKTEPNEALIGGILKAHLWEKLSYEEFGSDLEMFCLKNKLSKGHVQQILKLNLLSSKIVEAILAGKHPKHLLLRDLVRKSFPLLWNEQEGKLGFNFESV
jgi:hypothetical protein